MEDARSQEEPAREEAPLDAEEEDEPEEKSVEAGAVPAEDDSDGVSVNEAIRRVTESAKKSRKVFDELE